MKLNYLQSDSNIARNMADHLLLLCALIIGPFRDINSKQFLLIDICETSALQEALTWIGFYDQRWNIWSQYSKLGRECRPFAKSASQFIFSSCVCI